MQEQYVRKVSPRGQVALPRQLLGSLGVRPGDRVEFIKTDEGWAVRRYRPEGTFAKYAGALKSRRLVPLDSGKLLDELRGELPPEERKND
jgi:bifunctional DNA-binding transcriptional regulator/antitoxin component of YhaV-PrlF toxin-antitoxin module